MAEKSSIVTSKKNAAKFPHYYAIHAAIIKEPVWWSIRDLCAAFYDEQYTKSLDTQMRETLRAIAFDGILQKVIVSGPKGFKVAENDAEVIEYLDGLLDTADSIKQRYGVTKRKWGKHHQRKLKIGPYDTEEVIALYERPSLF